MKLFEMSIVISQNLTAFRALIPGPLVSSTTQVSHPRKTRTITARYYIMYVESLMP